MLALRKAGAYTLAQDRESCVVFGMPKEAIALGGIDEVVTLGEVARTVLDRAAVR
jgi:two-component system chemotaxis response regulator CheB